MSGGETIEISPVASPGDILNLRQRISEVYMDQKIVDYVVDLVRASRDPQRVGLHDVKQLIAFGASPRATIYLAQAARAHAYLRGRAYVVPEDIKAMAPDVLRHRILLTFEAEAEDITSNAIVSKLLEAVDVP
jgi:MoxR-like ATPase